MPCPAATSAPCVTMPMPDTKPSERALDCSFTVTPSLEATVASSLLPSVVMSKLYKRVTPCMPAPLALELRPLLVTSVPALISVMVSPIFSGEALPVMPTLIEEDRLAPSVRSAVPLTVSTVSPAASVEGR